MPATCAAAPAGKKPPQQFYTTTYHAELQTAGYGALNFDRGSVIKASDSSISIKRDEDGSALAFKVPAAGVYQCGLTASAAAGKQVSIASRGGHAAVIWPTTTQTPTIFKVTYHGVLTSADPVREPTPSPPTRGTCRPGAALSRAPSPTCEATASPLPSM